MQVFSKCICKVKEFDCYEADRQKASALSEQ